MSYLLPTGARYNGQGAIVFNRKLPNDKRIKLLEARIEELEAKLEKIQKSLEKDNDGSQSNN